MTPDEYLQRLQKQLKGLPPDKQAELMDEIRDHLEESRATPNSANPLGVPEDLGRRMQHIHRRNRWLDYLLVVLPSLILVPLGQTLLAWLIPNGHVINPSFSYWSIRVTFFIYLAVSMLALKRFQRFGEPELAVYWLSQVFWAAVAVCLRENRWQPAMLEGVRITFWGQTIFWTAAILISGAMIFWLVLRSRNAQAAVLALLPLCLAAGNWTTGQLMLHGQLAQGYHLPQVTIAFFGVTQISLVFWPAFFFLTNRRWLRWLGLLAYAAPLALLNLAASTAYPLLLALWSLPLAVVLVGWLIDWRLRYRDFTAIPG